MGAAVRIMRAEHTAADLRALAAKSRDGAQGPDRGVGAAIIMPAVNTEAMNEHLEEISTQVAAGAHAVLVLDGAGWHQAGGKLSVPDNITLLSLPP